MSQRQRFTIGKVLTDSERSKKWYVSDGDGVFPHWMFSRGSEKVNRERAAEACRILNTGVLFDSSQTYGTCEFEGCAFMAESRYDYCCSPAHQEMLQRARAPRT